jgi:hypothetical protein
MVRDVTFEFYSTEFAAELRGRVTTRRKSMTLDIPAQGGGPRYLIVGTDRGSFFEGTNQVRGPSSRNVFVRWTQLGPRYVGVWTEEGEEFVFTFFGFDQYGNRVSAGSAHGA